MKLLCVFANCVFKEGEGIKRRKATIVLLIHS